MKKDIHIRKNGTADDCDLDSKKNDEATWINDGDLVRRVVFDQGSPFKKEEYIVRPGIPEPSGPITATEKRSFHYDLEELASKAPAADPHIIIH